GGAARRAGLQREGSRLAGRCRGVTEIPPARCWINTTLATSAGKEGLTGARERGEARPSDDRAEARDRSGPAELRPARDRAAVRTAVRTSGSHISRYPPRTTWPPDMHEDVARRIAAPSDCARAQAHGRSARARALASGSETRTRRAQHGRRD